MQAHALPGKRTASASQGIYATGVMLVLALFVLVTYTFVHEAGHAIVGLLFGGSITEFNLNFLNLSAHVGIEGDFTTFQNSVIALAGASLPLLVWVVCVVILPGRSNIMVDSAKLIGSLAVLSTLLVWMVIPILYMGGGRPGDDSTNFLNYSGVPPLAVTGAALLIYIGGWAYYFRRIGGLGAIRDLVSRFRSSTNEFSAPAATKALVLLALAGAVVWVSSWALGAYLKQANPLALPAGYSAVATINLSEKGYADETIYRFSLSEQATASFYIALQDIPAGPMEISLVGPNGYRNTFLKFGAGAMPGGGIGRAKVHPTGLVLESGEYTLQLTVPRGQGQVIVSTKIDRPLAQVNRR